MYIVKVLKRKDAASIVVAVVLAFILAGMLPVMTIDLAGYLSGVSNAQPTEWRSFVVQPIISGLLQVVVLEAILRLVIWIRPFFVVKKTKK